MAVQPALEDRGFRMVGSPSDSNGTLALPLRVLAYPLPSCHPAWVAGDRSVSKALTVVLPVHNAEATLSRDVNEVLEIAGELASNLRLFIVDDGSTDDTFDIATELATKLPQLRVVRHSQKQGLGPAIESLRNEVTGDFVLVHDGASPIDAAQIRRLWLEERQAVAASSEGDASIDDLHLAAAVHNTMAAAHARIAGFRNLSTLFSDAQLTRRDEQQKAGVGVIPPLPRPNFMGALANFALGE